MSYKPKVAFIFPGQGAQYPGMGKDFFDTFSEAKQTYQEADDKLKRHLSNIIFNGPEATLTETKNSQLAIYTTSIALLRVVNKLFPDLKPEVCAGLSLGEYTAITASGRISFADGLELVSYRGQFMNDACEAIQGTMAVVMGLDADVVEKLVAEANLPRDLWVANLNCPGQIVVSGTPRGIAAATELAKARGAKRVLPLQVHGAFHSGLMRQAEERIAEHVHHAPMRDSAVGLVMNVTGDFVKDLKEIKSNMIKQITSPVRWEQGIRSMAQCGVDLFIEIGCGKTLAGMNKRIGVQGDTISIEKIEDISTLEKFLKEKALT